MTILTIANHKGGTGKTTTTLHTAAALGLVGFKTLVVDLDPQSFLTRTLGVGEPRESDSSAALFNLDSDPRTIPPMQMKGFDLIPSSTSLTRVMRQLNKPTDVFFLREALQSGLDYDVVMFDTAAAVTVFSLNALVASNFVLVPVTPEYQPVMGAEQTYQTIQLVQSRLNQALATPRFLCTQVDGRKRVHQQYVRYIKKTYGDMVMSTMIRTNTALSISHSDGTTTFDHDPYSRGARDYANATDELLQYMKLQVRTDTEPAVLHQAS